MEKVFKKYTTHMHLSFLYYVVDVLKISSVAPI